MNRRDRRRARRRRSCDGKVRYSSRNAADAGALRLHRDQGGERCRSYPCGFCGSWHIGHRRKRRPRAVVVPTLND